jgi:RHS repeat-associated protein
MGNWSYSYDNLNRLVSGSAASGPYSTSPPSSWSYDAFGNCTSGVTPVSSAYANYALPNNQIAGGLVQYDAAGNVTFDAGSGNSYLYDGEGRICAVFNAALPSMPIMTGYFYDAMGTRVAKGSLASFSCNFASNGFTPTTSYVLGAGGEQLTELSVSGAPGNYTSAWTHTNAFSGGHITATYTWSNSAHTATDTYFYLGDWLGTKRAEVGAGGCLSTFASLPYGDGLTPSGNCPDATEHHFTGKERDAESGNDYFGARYYASSMGRWMSPDPLPWIHWQRGNEDDQKKFEGFIVNPQNFDMYAYVNNNPLNMTDPTGMNACGNSNDSSCNVTITIRDRSKDAMGQYNDKYTNVTNQQGYNATATVSVNGHEAGIFLVKTTSSYTGYATVANGVYNGTFEPDHDGHPAIRLQPTLSIPTASPNPAQGGLYIAKGILVHISGNGNSVFGSLARPVSAGCQVVCTSQYSEFERATGLRPMSGPPQMHFSVDLKTYENATQSERFDNMLRSLIP